jgi:hypothetical protein
VSVTTSVGITFNVDSARRKNLRAASASRRVETSKAGTARAKVPADCIGRTSAEVDMIGNLQTAFRNCPAIERTRRTVARVLVRLLLDRGGGFMWRR